MVKFQEISPVNPIQSDPLLTRPWSLFLHVLPKRVDTSTTQCICATDDQPYKLINRPFRCQSYELITSRNLIPKNVRQQEPNARSCEISQRCRLRTLTVEAGNRSKRQKPSRKTAFTCMNSFNARRVDLRRCVACVTIEFPVGAGVSVWSTDILYTSCCYRSEIIIV
jgi:hypothetical protein